MKKFNTSIRPFNLLKFAHSQIDAAPDRVRGEAHLINLSSEESH